MDVSQCGTVFSSNTKNVNMWNKHALNDVYGIISLYFSFFLVRLVISLVAFLVHYYHFT